MLWAATFLGESVTPVQLLGMAIVLAAVWPSIALGLGGSAHGAGVVEYLRSTSLISTSS